MTSQLAGVRSIVEEHLGGVGRVREVVELGAPEAAKPVTIAALAAGREGPTLVLAASPGRASLLVEELALYAGDLPVAQLPAGERLPYELAEDDPAAIGERDRALRQLRSGERSLVVASWAAVAEFRAGPEVEGAGTEVRAGATLAPEPFTPGGPKIWGGGGVPAALRRCAANFDGWFPSGRGRGGADWGADWQTLRAHAEEAGRDPAEIAGAAYVTVAIDQDPKAAEAQLESYLARYYNLPPGRIRTEEYVFAGDRAAVAGWIAGFVEAGCDHLCVRVTGSDDARQMVELAELRGRIG